MTELRDTPTTAAAEGSRPDLFTALKAVSPLEKKKEEEIMEIASAFLHRSYEKNQFQSLSEALR